MMSFTSLRPKPTAVASLYQSTLCPHPIYSMGHFDTAKSGINLLSRNGAIREKSFPGGWVPISNFERWKMVEKFKIYMYCILAEILAAGSVRPCVRFDTTQMFGIISPFLELPFKNGNYGNIFTRGRPCDLEDSEYIRLVLVHPAVCTLVKNK